MIAIKLKTAMVCCSSSSVVFLVVLYAQRSLNFNGSASWYFRKKEVHDPDQFFTHVVCHHPSCCVCSSSSVIFFSVLYALLILYGGAQPVHVYTSGGKSDQEQFPKFIPAGMRLTTDFCKRDWVIYISLCWKIQIYYCLRFLKKCFELSGLVDQHKKSRTKTTQHSTRGTSVETSTITFFLKTSNKK